MKNIIFLKLSLSIIICFNLFSCDSDKVIDSEMLFEVDDLICLKSDSSVYTGKVIEYRSPIGNNIKSYRKIKTICVVKKGKLNGLYKSFYDNSKLKSEVIYKNGKREGKYRTFYENGKVMSKGNFKDNKRNGVCKDFFENGKLQSYNNYKNGKAHGVFKRFHENGKIHIQGEFINNIVTGKVKYYNNEGVLIEITDGSEL